MPESRAGDTASGNVSTQPARNLRQLIGPEINLPAPGANAWLIGRGTDCNVILPHPTVSRHHARIDWFDGARLLDLDSAGGVLVNGRRETDIRLQAGDRVTIGPWQFTVTETRSSTPPGDQSQTIIEARTTADLAAPRLELLMEFCSAINRLDQPDAIFQALADAARLGSGFQRALVLDLASPSLAAVCSNPPGLQASQASRQLIDGARGGSVMQLREIANDHRSDSVVAMQVTSAMAVALSIDNQPRACLYLDSRSGESTEQPDTARFCQVLAQMAALAVAQCLNNTEPPETPLSPRETDVLQLIGKGYSGTEVAGLLDISRNTAAGYIKEIYRKLGINSRAEAALKAAEFGLLRH